MEIQALSSREQVTYYLIDRYLDKASPRLRAKYDALRAKAKAQFPEFFRAELTRGDYLLKHVAKDEAWLGGCLSIPFKVP